MIEVSGGVVWNPQLGVIVVNQNHNSWSLPKGHVEIGENVFDAAVREIEEETGITKDKLTFVKAFPPYLRTRIPLHPTDQEEIRRMTLFFFTTDATTLSPTDPVNPEARFVPIKEVSNLLTHKKDKEFFETLINDGTFTIS